MKIVSQLFCVLLLVISYSPSFAKTTLDINNIALKNAVITQETYKGETAIAVEHKVKSGEFGSNASDQEGLLIYKNSNFTNGTIELEIASQLVKNAPTAARGFVGIAFRLKQADKYEAIYLRPTNGRANNQLRRNHSLQYISHPNHTWFSLRENNPGEYESYADLVLGEWTKVKIKVDGETAQLFLHGNEQPSLIINDLKHGKSSGEIAFWVGIGTKAFFKNIRVIDKY